MDRAGRVYVKRYKSAGKTGTFLVLKSSGTTYGGLTVHTLLVLDDGWVYAPGQITATPEVRLDVSSGATVSTFDDEYTEHFPSQVG